MAGGGFIRPPRGAEQNGEFQNGMLIDVPVEIPSEEIFIKDVLLSLVER